MRRLLFSGGVAVAALLLVPSCEVENCPPNALSYACFNLKDANGRNVSFTSAVSVIGETEAGGKDTIVNKQANAQSFSLPLSYADQTRFILVYPDQTTDTITVTHRNIPHFMNIDCGSMVFHEVQAVQTTRHLIDSIVITNPHIDNNEKENFQIYFPAVAD